MFFASVFYIGKKSEHIAVKFRRSHDFVFQIGHNRNFAGFTFAGNISLAASGGISSAFFCNFIDVRLFRFRRFFLRCFRNAFRNFCNLVFLRRVFFIFAFGFNLIRQYIFAF